MTRYGGSRTCVPQKTVPNFILQAQKLRGKVTSISMNKTVAVTVERLVKHPIYKKRTKVSKTYLAHAEEETFALGAQVDLEPSRPLSSRKHFVARSIAP